MDGFDDMIDEIVKDRIDTPKFSRILKTALLDCLCYKDQYQKYPTWNNQQTKKIMIYNNFVNDGKIDVTTFVFVPCGSEYLGLKAIELMCEGDCDNPFTEVIRTDYSFDVLVNIFWTLIRERYRNIVTDKIKNLQRIYEED